MRYRTSKVDNVSGSVYCFVVFYSWNLRLLSRSFICVEILTGLDWKFSTRYREFRIDSFFSLFFLFERFLGWLCRKRLTFVLNSKEYSFYLTEGSKTRETASHDHRVISTNFPSLKIISTASSRPFLERNPLKSTAEILVVGSSLKRGNK